LHCNNSPCNFKIDIQKQSLRIVLLFYPAFIKCSKIMAMSETDKFMNEFDPVNSNREKRKKERAQQSNTSASTSGFNNSRRFSSNKKGSCMYDDKGHSLHDGADVCDCLRSDCPGCFFPCPKCRSPKCAHDCRINRRYTFESIEVEGTETVISNKHLPSK